MKRNSLNESVNGKESLPKGGSLYFRNGVNFYMSEYPHVCKFVTRLPLADVSTTVGGKLLTGKVCVGEDYCQGCGKVVAHTDNGSTEEALREAYWPVFLNKHLKSHHWESFLRQKDRIIKGLKAEGFDKPAEAFLSMCKWVIDLKDAEE